MMKFDKFTIKVQEALMAARSRAQTSDHQQIEPVHLLLALLDQEDLLVRCRSVSIPPRTINAIQSDWMGMKQFFPSKPDVGGTFVATFEETEDMKIQQIFYEWSQTIFNVNPKSLLTAGKSKRPLKRQLTKDIFLIMFGYDGTPLPKSIRFTNAWVQNVADVPLDYGAGDSVKYSVTFQYDFWTLFPDTTALP